MSVYEKLQSDAYGSLSKVLRDVDEAWTNGEKLDEASMHPLTVYNRVIFKKEWIRCGVLTPTEWGDVTDKLRNRMSTLLGNPTPVIHEVAQTEFLPEIIEKPHIPLIEDIRYRRFLLAMEKCSEESASEVTNLARELEPEKVESALIEGRAFNVAELKTVTFEQLEERARELLEAEGIAYP
jgi:hypothetical protein